MPNFLECGKWVKWGCGCADRVGRVAGNLGEVPVSGGWGVAQGQMQLPQSCVLRLQRVSDRMTHVTGQLQEGLGMPSGVKRKITEGEVSARREQLREEAAAATRERIQTVKIVERLQSFALGEKFAGKEVKMTPAQIKAAEMLLDKTMPNLASVKLDVDAKQVVFQFGVDFDEPPAGDEKTPA